MSKSTVRKINNNIDFAFFRYYTDTHTVGTSEFIWAKLLVLPPG